MNGQLISKVYVATVEEFDLRHGDTIHQARRFDLQVESLPVGSTFVPSGPRIEHLERHRFKAGTSVHVTVTTTREGHLRLMSAGFRAPADQRELYEIVHDERRREHEAWRAKITGKPVPMMAAINYEAPAITDHAAVTADHPDVEAF